MRYYDGRDCTDLPGSLGPRPPRPPRPQAGKDSTGWGAQAGPGWLAVPPAVWQAFTDAVKRGDYDTPPRRPA